MSKTKPVDVVLYPLRRSCGELGWYELWHSRKVCGFFVVHARNYEEAWRMRAAREEGLCHRGLGVKVKDEITVRKRKPKYTFRSSL